MITLIISIALLFFVLYLVLCYVIADRFGRKHAAGFGWTFFFCFFGAILAGVILVMVSNGLRDYPKQRLVRIVGYCCIMIWLTKAFIFPTTIDFLQEYLQAIADQYPQFKYLHIKDDINIKIDFGPMLLSGLYLLFKRY